AHCDYVKDPSGRKLHQPIGNIRWRRRNLAGDRPVAFALLAVANHAVGLEERFAFFQSLRRCTIRIGQFAACSRCLFIPRAVMKRLITTRDGSSDWLLECETIPRYG